MIADLFTLPAAALSITTLYKSSLATSKQAYSAGYQACLTDVLQFVQAGVSIQGQGANVGAEGLTIGRIMDWIEGRLEAIGTADDDDDDDKATTSKGKARGGIRRIETTAQSPIITRSRPTQDTKPTTSNHNREEPRTRVDPDSDQGRDGSRQLRYPHSSPSPPRSLSPPPTKPPSRKERAQRQSFQQPPPTTSMDFPLITSGLESSDTSINPLALSPLNVSVDFPMNLGVGSKRRHGALFDGGSGASTSRAVSNQVPGSTRRRIRASRASTTGVPPTLFTGSVSPVFEPMEIEEREERARKVPRR